MTCGFFVCCSKPNPLPPVIPLRTLDPCPGIEILPTLFFFSSFAARELRNEFAMVANLETLVVPCIPKILRDTGVLKNIKRAFGMRTTTTKGTSNGKSAQFSSNLSHGKSVTATSKAYYKLDEDGIPMEPVESESTEQLHNAKLGAGITRTTRITVQQDDRSMTSDVEAGNGVHVPVKPSDEWPRPAYR